MVFSPSTYFVLLLIFVVFAYRVFPISAFLIVVVMVVTVVVLVGLGLVVVARRQRRWLTQIHAAQPDAAVVSAEWNAAVLAPLVADATLIAGSDPRRFAVMVTADTNGLQLWRGGARVAVPLGRIAWSELEEMREGQVRAALGPKRAATIRISFGARSSTLISPVELIVRKEPVPVVITRLLVVRRDGRTQL